MSSTTWNARATETIHSASCHHGEGGILSLVPCSGGRVFFPMGVPSLVFLVPQHCRCTCPRHSLPQGAAHLCISRPTCGLVSEGPGWQDKQLLHWRPLLRHLRNIMAPCPGPLGRLASHAPEPLPLPRPGEPHHDFELKVAAGRCSGGLAGRKVCSGPLRGTQRAFPCVTLSPQPRGGLSTLTQGG